jgi:AbrB family looped-hinge helix DNA binding protein
MKVLWSNQLPATSTKARKVGDSIVVSLPKSIRRAVHIEANDKLLLNVISSNHILITIVKEPRDA